MNDFEVYGARHDCRLCHSKNVELAVPLRPVPVAGPNVGLSDAADARLWQAVPLDLHLCRDCGLLQLMAVGNPQLQYASYTYKTATSLGLATFFKETAAKIIGDTKLPAKSLVVEFGSNDGTYLQAFKQQGMRVQGIDPAEQIARSATEAGIPTRAAYFDTVVAKAIREEQGSAALILANNVIANIDDMDELTAAVRSLLANDGLFIFQTQYGADVLRENLLDTIYHEHLSYFHVRPLQLHFRRWNMEVVDVQRIWTKGGSIQVTVQHRGGPRRVSPGVAALVAEEQRDGIYDLALHRRFSDGVEVLRNKIARYVEGTRAAGRKVCGYGASVGTVTLLIQFDLTDKIEALFDDNFEKARSLRGPGFSIPILPGTDVERLEPGLLVMFAWRYAKPIFAKHRAWFERGGRALVPLPAVQVIDLSNNH